MKEDQFQIGKNMRVKLQTLPSHCYVMTKPRGGDSVTLSISGKYLEQRKQKVNVASFAPVGGKTALLDQLNELALNTSRAGGANPIALLNLADILAKDLQSRLLSVEVPEAYLIYALYDQDSNRYEVGKQVLSRNAANQHEVLEEKLAIKKNGYIETFVVNETAHDVWFDHFRILSTGSLLVQETHGACPESKATREALGT